MDTISSSDDRINEKHVLSTLCLRYPNLDLSI